MVVCNNSGAYKYKGKKWKRINHVKIQVSSPCIEIYNITIEMDKMNFNIG